MFFGRIAAQLLAFAAIAGVFGEIPKVSEWAFWFMVGAYLLWLGVNRFSRVRIKWVLMLSILLILVAIVGVFVEIPIVSKYAFWVMAASYVIIVASTDIYRTSD
jgi:predicted branched-subunit amino acid permease